jgi:hypothetical protein
MYHSYSSFPISLGGCPNFDPVQERKWKEKKRENSTYYSLLRSMRGRTRCIRDYGVSLFNSSITFNAFCLSFSTMKLRWNLILLWVQREILEKLLTPLRMLVPFMWSIIFTFVGTASDEWLWRRWNHDCSTLKACSLRAMDGRHGNLLLTCMPLSWFLFCFCSVNPFAFSFVGWSGFCWGVLFPYWVHEDLDFI